MSILQKSFSEKQKILLLSKIKEKDTNIPYSNYRWGSTVRKEGTYGYAVRKKKMNTGKFRTRQEIVKRFTHPKGKDYIIGLDAGYSAMKVFHENGYFCFPSFAKKLDSDLTATDEKDIFYRDLDTGEMYILGYTAQDMINSVDTNDTEGELFSRKRYGNKKFRILCKAAIGIACMDKKDQREIVIQTGLPSSFLEADAKLMKNALSAPAHFELKLGHGEWREFQFQIKKENIYANMAQPAGAFYSSIIKEDGTYTPDIKSFMFGNTLVIDIGFGTFDFYGLKNRALVCKESIDEIGMKQVLKSTSKKILSEYGEDIRVPALQKCLETGKITCVNEEEMRTEEHSIAPLLEKSNDEVFKAAMEQAKGITSAFRDYTKIIVAGGTGEAWFEKIKEYLSGMKTITVLPGNRNDHLPFIYSNVRGYYMFQYMQQNKKKKG